MLASFSLLSNHRKSKPTESLRKKEKPAEEANPYASVPVLSHVRVLKDVPLNI